MSNRLKYGFRMVHVDNIPYIMKFGIVQPNSPNASKDYIPIGDTSVIRKRTEKVYNNVKLSDCIPFYLGPRSPMLYVIQNGYNNVTQIDPCNIVYCIISLQDIIDSNIDCFFSDGHALDAFSEFYPASELPNIDLYVKYSDVYTRFWNDPNDSDLKRRKEAELLIKEALLPQHIKGFVVYNDKAKSKLIASGIQEKNIIVIPDFYF